MLSRNRNSNLEWHDDYNWIIFTSDTQISFCKTNVIVSTEKFLHQRLVNRFLHKLYPKHIDLESPLLFTISTSSQNNFQPHWYVNKYDHARQNDMMIWRLHENCVKIGGELLYIPDTKKSKSDTAIMLWKKHKNWHWQIYYGLQWNYKLLILNLVFEFWPGLRTSLKHVLLLVLGLPT